MRRPSGAALLNRMVLPFIHRGYSRRAFAACSGALPEFQLSAKEVVDSVPVRFGRVLHDTRSRFTNGSNALAVFGEKRDPFDLKLDDSIRVIFLVFLVGLGWGVERGTVDTGFMIFLIGLKCETKVATEGAAGVWRKG